MLNATLFLWIPAVLFWSVGVLFVVLSCYLAATLVWDISHGRPASRGSWFWLVGPLLCGVGYLLAPLADHLWLVWLPLALEALAIGVVFVAGLFTKRSS